MASKEQIRNHGSA